MWLTSLVAVAFLLVPLGLGGWSLLYEDTSVVDSPWPSDPHLSYSFEANGSDEKGLAVFVDGLADDFYVADRGDDTSRVTRYVAGDAKWQVQVGYQAPRRLQVIDNRVFLSSSDENEGARFDRLDPETGEVMWTIASAEIFEFRIIENRLYVAKLVESGDTNWTLFEYEIDGGKELNRIKGPRFGFLDDGFVLIDTTALTLRRLDLEFQPVGEPVSIEASGVELLDAVWNHYDDGWVYFTNRTDFGGKASVVGLSEAGDKRFECETVVGEAREVEVRDGSTLIVSGFHKAEVLDLDGTQCESRWHTDPGDRTFIRFEQYPVAIHYPGTKEEIDYLLDDREISVLDWESGEPIANGEGFFLFNDVGDWMTLQEDVMIARKVESGDELWQIAAPFGTIPWTAPGWIAVIRQGPETSSIEVYTD